jgi:feruloyl esterase
MASVAVVGLGATEGASGAQGADCQSLTGKTFGEARVIETSEINGPVTVTSLDSTAPRGASIKVPFCRVRARSTPNPDSDIRFELWLPTPEAWNSKYQGVGNGGNAGTLLYPAMGRALETGYAVSGTDTGHVGAMGDSQWTISHPEKILDFGWRSIHKTAVASKALVNQYYGKAPARSYFNGCSTGGRQGLVEAQRFPEDYDGIVIGAPANYWPLLNAFGANHYKYLLTDPDNWLSPEKLALINKASLAACNGVGGLIDDPSQCKFSPSALLCRSGQSGSCLTDKEIATVQRLYSGLKDAAGNSIYPGLTPGAEVLWGLWRMGPSDRRGIGSLSYGFNNGFFRDWVMQDPNWDLKSFSFDADLSEALNGSVGKAVYADSPDLSAFEKRGGKLIHYHGWHDPAIPAAASIKYYQSVAANVGGGDKIQSFYRLFLGTGVSHCSGGVGPSAIGGASGLPAPSNDPRHDVVASLARWVEEGVAPDQITATRYVENDPSKGVESQRPWCLYPAAPRYDGKGDRNQASSYSCAQPEK